MVANGPETGDTNFYWAEYAQRINGELIGTFGNLVNRVLSFGHKKFPDGLRFPEQLDKESNRLLSVTRDAFPKVGKLIEEGKFRAAFKAVLEVAEQSNRYIDTKAPWTKIKDDALHHEVEQDLAVLVQVIRALAILVNPVLPRTSENIFGFLGLNLSDETWGYPDPERVYRINHVAPLYRKIEDEQIEEQQEKLRKLKSVKEDL